VRASAVLIMATFGNFVVKLCRPLCRKVQHVSKQLDKVGDEDTQTAIVRTAGRALTKLDIAVQRK
jgi:hypothetical protein